MKQLQRRIFKYALVSCLLALIYCDANAKQDPPYSTLLKGDSMKVGKSVLVKDTVFFNPSLRPTILRTNSVDNIISLRINEYSTLALPDSFALSVQVKLIYMNKNNLVDSSVLRTLSIAYNKFHDYKSRDILYLHDAYQMQVRIMQITPTFATFAQIAGAVELENRLQIDRDYVMDPVSGTSMNCSANAITSISSDPSTIAVTGELKLSWQPNATVESYDVEWAFVDKSAIDAGRYNTNGQLDPFLIFRNNATRMSLTADTCMIAMLYDGEGSLFYRVRGVQHDPSGELLTTSWSSIFGSSGGLGRFDFTGHERKLNWQATTSFAEEGKRKTVVQYFDGSLRSRQTLTRDNTNGNTIVAESFYDQQGRPVIQVLPAPTLKKLIGYNPGFNVRDMNGVAFDQGIYDTLINATDYCDKVIDSMSAKSGAAHYYSPANELADSGFHRLIPDAKGYAFSETQYTQDNTGRIYRQGGVGATFQIGNRDANGNAHDTRYFYAGADQNELDALFGTEAGDASHYQKNMVRDANGQNSVSYVDMHGRTVATALAGNSPAALQQLSSYRDSLQTEKLLTPANNVIVGNSIRSTKTILVPKADNVQFRYHLDVPRLTIADCQQRGICYTCTYDLNITLTDNCNNQLLGGSPVTFTKSNFKLFNIDTTCGLVVPMDTTFSVTLPEGSYDVTKTLSISQEGMQYYRDSLFLKHNTCLSFEDILHQEQTIVQAQSNCDNAPEIKNDYQSYQQDMLTDLYPLVGQYADTATGRDCRFSILLGTTPAYTDPSLSYTDDDGNPDLVVNNLGIAVPPNQLTKEEFIANFKNSWLKTLLIKHPEYPILQKFNSFSNSLVWDDGFNAVQTYAEAKAKGYLNPTGSSAQPASKFPIILSDPLFNSYPESAIAKQAIEQQLFTYQQFGSNSVSLWGFVTAMSKCKDADTIQQSCVFTWNQNARVFNEDSMCQGDLDMSWKAFRTIYQRMKHDWLMNYVKTVAPGLVIPPPCLANFASTQSILDAAGYPQGGNPKVKADSAAQAFYADNCRAYASRWWSQLQQGCTSYTQNDSATIINYLVEVCKRGSDVDHSYGSSSVKPGTVYRFSNFEQVVKFYNDSTGRATDASCNSYLIDKPLPYAHSQLLVGQPLFTKPDSCACSNINSYYQKFQANGQGYPTFSAYMLGKFNTAIKQTTLDSLLNLCSVNPTLSCKYLPNPIQLPVIFQCGAGETCVTCSLVRPVYDSFLLKFPGVLPTKDESDSGQQQKNQLFANYMNQRFGFSKTSLEYLAFLDSCPVSPCQKLQKVLEDYGKVRLDGVTHLGDDDHIITDLNANVSNGLYLPPDSIKNGPGSTFIEYSIRPRNMQPCFSNAYGIEYRFRFPQTTGRNGTDFYIAASNFPGVVMQAINFGAAPGIYLGVQQFEQPVNGCSAVGYYNNTDPGGPCYNFPGTNSGMLLLEPGVSALDNFITVRMQIRDGKYQFWYNGQLKFESPRTSTAQLRWTFSQIAFLRARDFAIDRVRVFGDNDQLVYNEDFNTPKTPATISPDAGCMNYDCQQSFINYYNQHEGTNYTYAQVDSIYRVTCGRGLQVCDVNQNKILAAALSYQQGATATAGWNVQGLPPSAQTLQAKDLVNNGTYTLPPLQPSDAGVCCSTTSYSVGTNAICLSSGYEIEARVKATAQDLITIAAFGDNLHNATSPGFYAQFNSSHSPGQIVPGTVNDARGTVAGDFGVLNNVSADFSDWVTLKVRETPSSIALYANGILLNKYVKTAVFDPTRIAGVNGFYVSFGRNVGSIDWARISDTSGHQYFYEDFSTPHAFPAAVDPSVLCSLQGGDCQTQFAAYYNQRNGTSLSYVQIDAAYYVAAGVHLQLCNIDSSISSAASSGVAKPATISCSALSGLYQNFLADFPDPSQGARVTVADQATGLNVDSVFDCRGLFEWYFNNHLNTSVIYSYENFTDWLINGCGAKIHQLPCAAEVVVTRDTLVAIRNAFNQKYPDSLATITETVALPIQKLTHLIRMYSGSTVTADYSGPSTASLAALTWTTGGQWFNVRDNIGFDFRSIPASAVISNATLNLFAKPDHIEFYPCCGAHFRLISDNVFGILSKSSGLIVPGRTSLTRMPVPDETNHFNFAPISIDNGSGNSSQIFSNQDYTNLGITPMIQDLFTSSWQNRNYGLVLRLNEENIFTFKEITFWGISNLTPVAKLPKLNVTYTANRCDLFTAFVNKWIGTHLSSAQVQQLYATKGDGQGTACGAIIPPVFPDNGPTLCGNNPSLDTVLVYKQDDPCADTTNTAIKLAVERFRIIRDSLMGSFEEAYQQKCLSALNLEAFSVQHHVSEYHYTLYYYDQAGNLIKTVPPEGVHPNRDATWLAQVSQKRDAGLRQVPIHTMPTVYRYNTLNQVVTQNTPDAGLSEFWYDKLGRLAVSRNAQQRQDNRYSYTLYDSLGRIREVGQKLPPSAMTNLIARDTLSLANWLAVTYGNPKQVAEQVTTTQYDQVDPLLPLSLLIPVTQKPYTLRNRVSFSRTYSTLLALSNGKPSYGTYDYGTTYTYDIHGNVDTLVQSYPAGILGAHADNRYKTIAYKYDLISGKVNQVHYQPGLVDQLYHRYAYDAENRLTDVFTTDNKLLIGNVNLEEHEAQYAYYLHGPLARTIIGHQQVQSVDYAYTLQGWLKAVNPDSTLNPGNVARDAYNFSLHYFGGDYKSIGNTMPLVNASGNVDFRNLYNGNIGAMAVNIKKLNQPLVYNYGYDQLNRLKSMDAYGGWDGNSVFAPQKLQDYHEAINYDANGNIQNYLRNGTTAGGRQLAMDNLGYGYNVDANGFLANNRLRHVKDPVPAANYTEDIDSQVNDNYQYDSIGNLKADQAEGITNISWSVYGKILQIDKPNDANARKIVYAYDAGGNRISKQVYTDANGGQWKVANTLYVIDALGNVIAIYQSSDNVNKNNGKTVGQGTLALTEQHLYGGSRLGVWNRNVNVETLTPVTFTVPLLGTSLASNFSRGFKNYELTNHLGNVLVTVGDRKKGVDQNGDNTIDYLMPDITAVQDYFDGGMQMPGRKSQLFGRGRIEYQGQETDKEFYDGAVAFEYRIEDPRLSRFLSVDPLFNEYPWNTPYAVQENKFGWGRELEGLELISPIFSMEPPVETAVMESSVSTAATSTAATSTASTSASSSALSSWRVGPGGNIFQPKPWTSFDLMPWVTPMQQPQPQLKNPNPNQNPGIQQVPQKNPQPKAEPQKQYDPTQKPTKEDDGEDGYYIYETASSEKIKDKIVRSKNPIPYYGITGDKVLGGRYSYDNERALNFKRVIGKTNYYTAKGVETALILLNTKGYNSVLASTRIDNKQVSTRNRNRLLSGILWLRANYGNDWQKKFNFLKTENPKGAKHPG